MMNLSTFKTDAYQTQSLDFTYRYR